MLDTKLKKMRNLKVLIITLTILLPAIMLVALYPRMGQVYEQKIKEQEAESTADIETEEVIISMESSPDQPVSADAEYELSSQFVNYAMEASYYLYGQMLQDTRETEVDISVLDQYGWINDYYTLADQCEFYAEYESDAFTKDSIETETLYRKK